MALRRDADFTEDAVSLAIEVLLATMCFPRLQFSVEPFSRSKERWLGADARIVAQNITGFRPFYMQFKRPFAYPDNSKSRVILDRKKLNLTVSPQSLFFPLRDKHPAHNILQHNVLFRLRERLLRRRLGDAAYICPLFMDRSNYRFHVHLTALRRWWPFSWREPWDLEDILVSHGSRTLHFERVPILAEHVSIPPHASVQTAKHKYSFTESGDALCFHSPISLLEGAKSFAKFLTGTASDFLDEGGKIQYQNASSDLEFLVRREADDPFDLSEYVRIDESDPIGSWMSFGDFLRREFGIEQYAFVSWREIL